MFARMFNGLIQLIIGTVQICIRLIILQFIPAIFFVAVWITEQALLLFTGQAAKLRPGLIVVLSTVAWSLIWLFVWLVSFNLFLVSDLTLWIGIAGGLWGLAVGGTIARDWSPPLIIAPPVDSTHASGLHGDMLVDEPAGDSISVEELFEQGIFFGHNVNKSRKP